MKRNKGQITPDYTNRILLALIPTLRGNFDVRSKKSTLLYWISLLLVSKYSTPADSITKGSVLII
ncbi:MAG: hypothetical protein IPI90_07770 [Saprospiraceae bacterium]|nr:hypothetical protein [Candidatus Vicinibacter affinis]